MAREFWRKLWSGVKEYAPAVAGGVVGGPATGLAILARTVAAKKRPELADEASSLEEVASTILGDPALQVELKRIALEEERLIHDTRRAGFQADTARLESVNATMRAETQQEDNYVKRARPTTLYVTFCGLVPIVVVWALIDPESVLKVRDVIQWAIGATMVVNGLSVSTRGLKQWQEAKNANGR